MLRMLALHNFLPTSATNTEHSAATNFLDTSPQIWFQGVSIIRVRINVTDFFHIRSDIYSPFFFSKSIPASSKILKIDR